MNLVKIVKHKEKKNNWKLSCNCFCPSYVILPQIAKLLLCCNVVFIKKIEETGSKLNLSNGCKTILLLAWGGEVTKPRMLCNGNGALSHLQMRVSAMGYVVDFRYSLHNS